MPTGQRSVNDTKLGLAKKVLNASYANRMTVRQLLVHVAGSSRCPKYISAVYAAIK